MVNSARKHIRSIATIGVASALAVGGVAVAQGGSHGAGSHHRGGPPSGKRMPPPPGGPMGKDLTYAQFHVQRNGQGAVVRIDQGKITAVDDSSITLTENDGSSVTVPLDSNTKVMAGPGRNTSVSDLKVGQKVLVCGPDGGTAKTIVVPPKRGSHRGAPPAAGRQGGQLPPSPPGM
jgi:hypothetical protein